MGRKEWIKILESDFQKSIIDTIKRRFSGSIVLKNDANYIQGFPDLIILYKDKWACLEVKRDHNSSRQPNQEWYIDLLKHMSFAAFIHPNNKEEILNELACTFES